MTTSARLVDEINGNVIWLERDESDPLWCDSSVFTGELDLGYATPRAVLENNPDVDGTTDLTTYYANRTIAWHGWITPCATDPFPALTWDAIKGLTAPNRRPYLYVSEDGWVEERRMVLRGDTITAPLNRQYGPVIVAQVQWVCPSGTLESSTLHQQSIQQSGGTGGLCALPPPNGFCFAPTCGRFFAPGNFGGATNIYNAGTATAYPVITFIGPCKNPRIVNLQTQQGIYLNTTLVKNQQVVVGCEKKTVNETAQPPINRLAWYDFTRSTWLSLPGRVSVPFSYTSDDRQGQCLVTWRDRWV